MVNKHFANFFKQLPNFPKLLRNILKHLPNIPKLLRNILKHLPNSRQQLPNLPKLLRNILKHFPSFSVVGEVMLYTHAHISTTICVHYMHIWQHFSTFQQRREHVCAHTQAVTQSSPGIGYHAATYIYNICCTFVTT